MTDMAPPNRPQGHDAAISEDERAEEIRSLRNLWLSRLMFNVFVGFAPETRSFPEFLEDHGVS